MGLGEAGQRGAGQGREAQVQDAGRQREGAVGGRGHQAEVLVGDQSPAGRRAGQAGRPGHLGQGQRRAALAERGQHGQAPGQGLDELPAQLVLGRRRPGRQARGRRAGPRRRGLAQVGLHRRHRRTQPGEQHGTQFGRRVPAGVAHHARHAGCAAGARFPYRCGHRDQPRFDQLVVQRPAVPPGPLRPLLEVVRGGRRWRWYGWESGVLGILRPPGAPPLPVRLGPSGREQRAGRGAFGREQVADTEAH